MFEDTILLKIRRDFTQDEAVKYLQGVISELKIEIGILKSELAEKSHELHVLKNPVIIEQGKTKKLWMQDELIKQYHEQLSRAKTRNKLLEKKVTELQNLYLPLKFKLEKQCQYQK
jgi:predicted RNase H-like nuclease (RuvC/YqgF family)